MGFYSLYQWSNNLKYAFCFIYKLYNCVFGVRVLAQLKYLATISTYSSRNDDTNGNSLDDESGQFLMNFRQLWR